MIAAASPGANDSDTFDSTGRSPCGDGYDLPTPLTSSMRFLVRVEHAIGGAADAVVLAHAVESVTAELCAQPGFFPQLVETLGETLRVVRLHENSAGRVFQHLGKGAVPRLHDGHTTRHR